MGKYFIINDNIAFGIIIFLIFLIGFAITNGIAFNKAKDEVCQDLGYEKHAYLGSFNLCEDNNGDLHYIKYEEPSFNLCLTKDCFDLKMKEISVGDVRVLK